MAHYSGLFHGYRERDPPVRTHRRLAAPVAPLGLPKLDPIQIEMMETPTLGNATFGREYAEDEFPEDFTLFGFVSRHIVLWLRHAPVDVIYTFDGETPLETRVIAESYRGVEAAQGFKIRNGTPGFRAWYQLIAFW